MREYGSKFFVSMAKEGCEIVHVEDIGETAPDEEVLEDDYEELTDAEVVGVVYLEEYRSCLRCKARVEAAGGGFGRCSKEECKMLQKYDKCTCHISTKLVFESKSTVMSLYAHGQMVCEIAAVDNLGEISEEVLLQAPTVRKVKYNQQHTIIQIVR